MSSWLEGERKLHQRLKKEREQVQQREAAHRNFLKENEKKINQKVKEIREKKLKLRSKLVD